MHWAEAFVPQWLLESEAPFTRLGTTCDSQERSGVAEILGGVLVYELLRTRLRALEMLFRALPNAVRQRAWNFDLRKMLTW